MIQLGKPVNHCNNGRSLMTLFGINLGPRFLYKTVSRSDCASFKTFCFGHVRNIQYCMISQTIEPSNKEFIFSIV